jgi:hypothetical protein
MSVMLTILSPTRRHRGMKVHGLHDRLHFRTAEGRLKDVAPKLKSSKRVVREIQRLQELETAHKLLLKEHRLLEQAIRFCSERRPTYSRSSRAAARTSR